MTQDIDKLVEMALEFSDIGDNPTDYKTHSALKGERANIYLSIISDKFWDAVKNGVYIKLGTERYDDKNAFFNQRDAAENASHNAWLANGETYEPRKGLVIMAEKKILRPDRPRANMMQQLAAQAGVVKSHFVDPLVTAKDMFAVVFPSDANGWGVPIKTFIAQARRGDYEPGIPASKEKGGKFGKPTQEGWQHAVLRWVQNLLNYSPAYFDYLTGDELNALGITVVREATRLGLAHMLSWTGREFMEWIYDILPPMRSTDDTGLTKEQDIEHVVDACAHDGSKLPFYNLLRKYTENTAYEVHSGRRPMPQRHD